MPASTTTQEALEKTYAIFPEAWYDLIARITPGAFASVVTWKRFQSPSGILEGIVGLILFYLISFFLEVFAEGIISIFWPQMLQENPRPLAGKPTQESLSNEPSRPQIESQREHKAVAMNKSKQSKHGFVNRIQAFTNKGTSKDCHRQGAKRTYEDIEFWNRRHKLRPSQWQAISKMSAECDLFKSLVGFFIIQIILFVLSCFSSHQLVASFQSMQHLSSLTIWPWEISALMAATCLCYTRKLHKSTLLRLESYIVLNEERLQAAKADT